MLSDHGIRNHIAGAFIGKSHLGHYLNVRIFFSDCLFKSFQPLVGYKEIHVIKDNPDFAFAAQLLAQQLRRDHAIPIVIGGYTAHIILARFKTGRYIVHEYDLRARISHALVSVCRGCGVRRNADQNVRLLRHDRFQICHLLLRRKIRICYRNYFNPQFFKCIFEALPLCG